MTGGAVWLTVGALITAVCALIGVVYTARTSHRATREQAQASPYKDMGERLDKAYERMDKQDETINALKTELRALREDLATERKHSAFQDQRIREVQHRWQAWAREITEEWESIRLNPHPPALPRFDEQPG